MVVPVPAAALPTVQAHRGGPLVNGQARYGENTLTAFRRSRSLRVRLELDVRLSSNLVPVVFHDHQLARATNCTGRLQRRTAAQLRQCVVNEPRGRGDSVPTLARVLGSYGTAGATWNIELKGIDAFALPECQPPVLFFNPARCAAAARQSQRDYAERVTEVLDASRIPRSRFIISSFSSELLTLVKQRIASAHPRLTSVDLLLFRHRNGTGRDSARSAVRAARELGATWIGAHRSVRESYVDEVHDGGLKFAMYTLNRADQVRTAVVKNVDSVISDDPTMARRTLCGTVGRSPPCPL